MGHVLRNGPPWRGWISPKRYRAATGRDLNPHCPFLYGNRTRKVGGIEVRELLCEPGIVIPFEVLPDDYRDWVGQRRFDGGARIILARARSDGLKPIIIQYPRSAFVADVLISEVSSGEIYEQLTALGGDFLERWNRHSGHREATQGEAHAVPPVPGPLIVRHPPRQEEAGGRAQGGGEGRGHAGHVAQSLAEALKRDLAAEWPTVDPAQGKLLSHDGTAVYLASTVVHPFKVWGLKARDIWVPDGEHIGGLVEMTNNEQEREMRKLSKSGIILDTETTGLSIPPKCGIIEVAAIAVVDGFIVSTYQELVNPGPKILDGPEVDEALELTGITREMLKGKMGSEEAGKDFARWLVPYCRSNFTLHGWNQDFDRKFLYGIGFNLMRWVATANKGKLPVWGEDVMRAAMESLRLKGHLMRELIPYQGGHRTRDKMPKLTEAAQWFEVDGIDGAHRAMADVLMTHQIAKKILEERR